MQLENRFSIPVAVEEAWDLLLDVRRVIPCFPGASVGEVTGDEIEGSVRIKLGPVLLNYAGTATFVERDPQARRAVLSAQGRDRKGGGSATATITASLQSVGADATECVIVTDLDVTGRPAQFGRGIMAEVGNRITEQFAANLSAMLTAPSPETEAPDRSATGTNTTSPGDTVGSSSGFQRTGETPPAADSLDLLEFARGAAVKRLLPIVGAAAVALIALAFRRGGARSFRYCPVHCGAINGVGIR